MSVDVLSWSACRRVASYLHDRGVSPDEFDEAVLGSFNQTYGTEYAWSEMTAARVRLAWKEAP